MILRVISQVFVCTCVATLLAMGIGASYLAATGKIDRGKVLKILADGPRRRRAGRKDWQDGPAAGASLL